MQRKQESEIRSRHLYHATADELKAIDEGLPAIERGEIASDAEV
jgi:hypothetical protein